MRTGSKAWQLSERGHLAVGDITCPRPQSVKRGYVYTVTEHFAIAGGPGGVGLGGEPSKQQQMLLVMLLVAAGRCCSCWCAQATPHS